MATQRKTFPRLFLARSEPFRLVGDRVFLRPPERGDYEDWASLRARSRNFLTPWEPSWPPDALSRTSFRARIARYAEDWRIDQGYNFFIFRHDETLVGGIGFGLFIDEVGKFVTSDNNYFYKPTAAIVYVVFVLIVLAAKFFTNRRPIDPRERLANVVDHAVEGVAGGLSRRRLAQASIDACIHLAWSANHRPRGFRGNRGSVAASAALALGGGSLERSGVMKNIGSPGGWRLLPATPSIIRVKDVRAMERL